jgi:hypothetical protein
MNQQFPATDLQFTRLIQFRQAAYDLYCNSGHCHHFLYSSIFLLTYP